MLLIQVDRIGRYEDYTITYSSRWVVSQAKLAQSSKLGTSASSSGKGRVSPDSEQDGSGCPVLSDGAVVRSAEKGSVPRRSKRPSQNGKRKGCGLLSVKSAPELVEMGLAATEVRSAEAAESESVTELRSAKAAESLLETGLKLVDSGSEDLLESGSNTGNNSLILKAGNGSVDKGEGSSDSDSDAPCSPPARGSD